MQVSLHPFLRNCGRLVQVSFKMVAPVTRFISIHQMLPPASSGVLSRISWLLLCSSFVLWQDLLQQIKPTQFGKRQWKDSVQTLQFIYNKQLKLALVIESPVHFKLLSVSDLYIYCWQDAAERHWADTGCTQFDEWKHRKLKIIRTYFTNGSLSLSLLYYYSANAVVMQ